MRRSRKQFRRGFTLLELVLVLLLLCICVATAAPSLRGFWHGSRIKDAGDQIMAITRWSRTQAIWNDLPAQSRCQRRQLLADHAKR